MRYLWRLLVDRDSAVLMVTSVFLRLFYLVRFSRTRIPTLESGSFLELTLTCHLHFFDLMVAGLRLVVVSDMMILLPPTFSHGITSRLAQRYDCITIDVHPDRPAQPSISSSSRQEASAIRRRAPTQRRVGCRPTSSRTLAGLNSRADDSLIASPPASTRGGPFLPRHSSGRNLFGFGRLFSPDKKRVSSKQHTGLSQSLAPVANQYK
jgi:hypothetical protein